LPIYLRYPHCLRQGHDRDFSSADVPPDGYSIKGHHQNHSPLLPSRAPMLFHAREEDSHLPPPAQTASQWQSGSARSYSSSTAELLKQQHHFLLPPDKSDSYHPSGHKDIPDCCVLQNSLCIHGFPWNPEKTLSLYSPHFPLP